MSARDFLSTLARETGGKVADHRVATVCSVPANTVRKWRYGERRIPDRIIAQINRLRAERARRLIEEGKRELAAVIAEERQ